MTNRIVEAQDIQAFVFKLNEKFGIPSGLLKRQYGYELMDRYARIYYDFGNGSQRSVHSFIDLTNGNIHKAASWKGTNKKLVRANLYEAGYMDKMDQCGPKYSRRGEPLLLFYERENIR